MTTIPSVANPFIGPRSFERGERLFGRDHEMRDLLHLLIAERVVLLYSPSGAGKSSLIKAALIPALERKGFVPLPPIRVNQELPPGAPPEANRFVYSTLLSLEEYFPPTKRLDEAALAGMGLAGYLQQRLLPPIQAAGQDPMLLFDQFEEVLTADPTRLDAKHAFFAQLGQALADRRFWALFAMREDYVTALDPYLTPIPGRFKDTFRLDLLGVEAACQAMQGPAQAAGVEFTPLAAERLSDDLRRTRVQRPDGTSAEVLGPYVEPVQLQVVCLRLWERRFGPDTPEREPVITPEDITDVGDVDSALAGYYTDRVQAAAETARVGERTIRDWFDRELITGQGQRGQVMREAGASGGLDNHAVLALVDSHLVRGDERHGTVWYELAHDRLVAPVQQSNTAWRAAMLTSFQRQAALWEEQGRPDGLLLQGKELDEGERWAEADPAALTEGERAFLEACRKARAIGEQQARANRRIRQALVGALVAAVVAIGLAGFAYVQRQEAEQERRHAEQQRLVAQVRGWAAQAVSVQQQSPLLGLQLALLAWQNGKSSPALAGAVRESLQVSLSTTGGVALSGHTGAVPSVAFSPDGRWLASGGADATVRLWRVDAPQQAPLVLQAHLGPVHMVAFSPDGRWLASAGADTTVRLWRLDALGQPARVLRGHIDEVMVLAWSPDSRWLASAGFDGAIRLWLPGGAPEDALVLEGHNDEITALAWSPDGQRLASGSLDTTLRLWDVRAPEDEPLVLEDGDGQINTLAWSPDGRWLASGSSDLAVRLWALGQPDKPPLVLSGFTSGVAVVAFSPDPQRRLLATGTEAGDVRLWQFEAPDAPPQVLTGHSDGVRALAFSPDGRWLGSTGFDRTAHLWQLDAPARSMLIFSGHTAVVNTLAFSPDSRWVATGSDDQTARLWPLNALQQSPYVLAGHQSGVVRVVFTPDGRQLASASNDATVRLWPLAALDQPPAVLRKHIGAVSSVDISPDGRWLAAGSNDTVVSLWRMDAPEQPERLLLGHDKPIEQVRFSPDGRWLASSGRDNIIQLWHMDSDARLPIRLERHTDVIRSISFSPDSRWLASADAAGAVLVWSLDQANGRALVAQPEMPAEPVNMLAWSPDSRLLAWGTEEHGLALWHADAPEQPATQLGGDDSVVVVAWSPDGRLLAAGDRGATVQLWRTTALEEPPLRLQGHTSDISALAFSPDGQWLASGSVDTTVHMWPTDALDQPPTVLRGHTNRITNLAFSPDSAWLASASFDSTVRVWLVRSDDLVARACATLGRNPTADAWRGMVGDSLPYAPLCPEFPADVTVYRELLAHGQFDRALEGYTRDRQGHPDAPAPAAWLVERAADLVISPNNPFPLLVDNPSPMRAPALNAYARALALDPALAGASPRALYAVCGYAAFPAPTVEVRDACDRLVALAPDEPYAHAVRGRVRALQGDRPGALADLETALAAWGQRPEGEHERDRVALWIADLQAGRDPFGVQTPAPQQP